MTPISSLIADRDILVAMPTAELAGYVLESLMSARADEAGIWNRRNFCSQAAQQYVEPRTGGDFAVGVACSAAWAWLDSNGLICRHPEQDNEWFVPTPRGREVRDRTGLLKLIDSEFLPASALHRDLLSNVRPLFLQSRFETAVFEAFKTLEIAIRTAAHLGHDLVGVGLASHAFHPENGKLSDLAAERGERVALMNLMTGALGSYKNPSSHRRVAISAEEARDMIVLASHLLKIVENRSLPPA